MAIITTSISSELAAYNVCGKSLKYSISPCKYTTVLYFVSLAYKMSSGIKRENVNKVILTKQRMRKPHTP